MTRFRSMSLALLSLAIAGGWISQAQAQETEAPATLPAYSGGVVVEGAPQPDLFYNYYPNTSAGVNSANLYPAPYPTPPHVGHTYYTYQPLLPHEYLYEHSRVYYNTYGGPEAFYQDPGRRRGACNPGYGVNKTTVVYQSGFLSYKPMPARLLPLEGIRGLAGCRTCR